MQCPFLLSFKYRLAAPLSYKNKGQEIVNTNSVFRFEAGSLYIALAAWNSLRILGWPCLAFYCFSLPRPRIKGICCVSLGCPRTQQSFWLSLLSDGVWGMSHHTQFIFVIFSQPFTLTWILNSN